ncbi:hypothetical protein F4811DRAFT_538414 [Daldinia bambusicola]|nr:hypothetical protein F4811DRAFT_538414 [Daldinia bambusicola]
MSYRKLVYWRESPMATLGVSSQTNVTAGSPLAKETGGSVKAKDRESHHKRKRGEYEAKTAPLKGKYYEVDENNIAGAFHTYPACKPRFSPIRAAVPRTGCNPIQWRSHDEVAIEATEFKQPMALHDLVDESNVSLMVVARDYAIIQGQTDPVKEC